MLKVNTLNPSCFISKLHRSQNKNVSLYVIIIIASYRVVGMVQ